MAEKQYIGKAEFGAVVLAAGSGSRMNEKIAKQYLPLGGKPLICYALRAFEESDVAQIVLVVAGGHEDYCRKEIVERFGFSKVRTIVAGGSERCDSVQAGLKALSGADYVLIHDAARPFVDQAMLVRTMEAVKAYQAVVVGMPVKDTIKIVDAYRTVVETPDRRSLWQVQTPQAFSYPLIRDAYDKVLSGRMNISQGSVSASAEAARPLTDDAQVLELAYGKKCKLIEGSYRNIKVTTPEDLEVAEVFCSRGRLLF